MKNNAEQTVDQEIEQTADYDTMVAEAELRAAADEMASGDRQETEETEAMEENPYEVKLSREYSFYDGTQEKTYDTLDLSGLVDLTTVDGEMFDRVLQKMNYRPANKFNDLTYCKHVAMKVTGLPAEFFNMLSIRDMIIITSVVYHFFLFG